VWVFWIHASNVTRFEQGYRDIASAAKIAGRDDPKNNILQLVYDWLRDKENGHWLMVLDNVDDNNVFFDTVIDNKLLADYLPQTPNGSILITSRDRMVVQDLVGTQSNVIPVEPMSADDAVALLRNRINGNQSTETEERALVEALEYIPLAISQAASYIANRSPRITVSNYLEVFRQHLLSYDDAKDPRRVLIDSADSSYTSSAGIDSSLISEQKHVPTRATSIGIISDSQWEHNLPFQNFPKLNVTDSVQVDGQGAASFDDMATITTDNEVLDLEPDSKTHYVTEFASQMARNLGMNNSVEDIESISRKLPLLLKLFAVRLGHTAAPGLEKDATTFIRHYRR
jgi:hypothetical protein